MQTNTQENTPRFTHRIYGRIKDGNPTEKRFRPLNLKDGRFVVNLMYATMLTESEVARIIPELNADNPNMQFEARKMSSMF